MEKAYVYWVRWYFCQDKKLIDRRVYVPDAMIFIKDIDYTVEFKTNVRSLHVIERLNNIRMSYEKDTGRLCNVIIIYKLISLSIFTNFEKFIYLKFDGENFEYINEVRSLIK